MTTQRYDLEKAERIQRSRRFIDDIAQNITGSADDIVRTVSIPSGLMHEMFGDLVLSDSEEPSSSIRADIALTWEVLSQHALEPVGVVRMLSQHIADEIREYRLAGDPAGRRDQGVRICAHGAFLTMRHMMQQLGDGEEAECVLFTLIAPTNGTPEEVAGMSLVDVSIGTEGRTE